ncbi:MAG: caspase family protein [Rhizobiaceae bacterium]|nr:caspase family protein [Rhizobiaceae bacterium]
MTGTFEKLIDRKSMLRNLNLLILSLCLILLIIGGSLAATKDKRVALVIGNSAYENVSKLANPKNDAADMSVALTDIGFDVTKIEDASFADMRQALRKFSKKARNARIALVYFAGHGIEVDRQNYLIPTDAVLASDQDIEYEAISIDLLNRSVSGASGLSMILLDACRNNPFANKMKTEKSTRSIGRGLAPVEPNIGSLISYAAREGTTADDGEGRNSPYTKALLNHIKEPGVDVRRIFDKVRDSVMEETGGVQQPFVYSSLPGRDVLLTPKLDAAPSTANTSAPSAINNAALELEYWNSVKDSGSIELLNSYIAQYPTGSFAAIAKFRIKNLEAKTETASAVAPITKDQNTLNPQSPEAFSQTEIRIVQTQLRKKGYGIETVDGIAGSQTRDAIIEYQSDWQIAETGQISRELIDRLQRKHPDTKARMVKAANSDCELYDTSPEARMTLEVTGTCKDGDVVGRGEIIWTYMRQGKFVTSEYKGNFVNGKISGFGTRKFISGNIYRGEMINGIRNGRGKLTYANGDVYEGHYEDGERHGRGIYSFASGSVYEGTYKNGLKDGYGVYRRSSGSVYEGPYKDGVRHGIGRYTFSSGNYYEGEFKNDIPNGQGKYVKTDGKIRTGLWNNGCYKDGSDWAVVLTTAKKCGFK